MSIRKSASPLWICQKGAFLCGDLGTRVQITFQKCLRTGFLGGEGFVMQKLSGTGRAFIHACGALKVTELGPQDQLRIDTGCLVALASTCATKSPTPAA